MRALGRIRTAVVAGLMLIVGASAQSPPSIIITGYLSNPQGNDSPFEYAQFVAARDIDFSTENHSVIFVNNGAATANGWLQGLAITYGFQLTTGSVKRGDVFYVGGNGRLINGTGSTSIAGLTWIRDKNTGTTAGDGGLGTANSGGVMGNGGANSDAVGVFSGLISGMTNSTVPVDALFFGTGNGTAVVAGGTAGYQLPVNDRYSGGKLQSGSFLFPDQSTSGQFIRLGGSYHYTDNAWNAARTGSAVNLTLASVAADIASTTKVNYEMTWNAVSGAWNNSTASTNWTTTGSVATNFLDGDRVVFSSGTGGNIAVDAGGVVPASVVISAPSGLYTFSGGAIGGATTTLSKSGNGTATLYNTNTYGGATTITGGALEADVLANGNANSSIGSSSNAAANLVINGGVLRYIGATTSSNRLFSIGTAGGAIEADGSGTLTMSNTGAMDFNGQSGARTLTLGGTNTGVNTLGVLIGDNGGATSLNKTGAGAWSLTNANTYSGTTTVSGGKLLANNSNVVTESATGSGNVNVGALGTLGGSGRVAGTVSVSGTIAPGNSLGVLTAGATTMNANSTYAWEVSSTNGSAVTAGYFDGGSGAAGTQHDQLVINGALDFSGATTFSISSIDNNTGLAAALAGFTNTGVFSWLVAQTTGGITGLSNVSINDVAFVAANGPLGSGQFFLTAQGNNLFLTFAPVPEPTTVLSSLAGVALCFAALRRRGKPLTDSASA